jgi:hypothetical protein
MYVGASKPKNLRGINEEKKLKKKNLTIHWGNRIINTNM